MNKIMINTLASSLSGAALLSSGLAGAVEFAYQPRLEGGLMYYEYESQPASFTNFDANGNVVESISVSGFEFNDTMFFIGGGFTFFADRFFVDLSAQRAFSGDDSSESSELLTFNNNFLLTGTERSLDADFERFEWAISAGYSVTDNWAVYAGYKNAESEFDIDQNGTITVATPLGSATGAFSSDIEFDFEQDGPFIGTTYGWQINQGNLQGLLSANFAVAFLDGEITNRKIRNAEIDGEEIPDDQLSSPTFEGDTVGLTFGVGWKGFTPVEGLTYTLGINGYQYDFDADERTVSDVKETQINFRAGVAYTF